MLKSMIAKISQLNGNKIIEIEKGGSEEEKSENSEEQSAKEEVNHVE